MKRFADNISPGRWKRICPPADDSDSDSSSDSSDETAIDFYRRLYRYGGPNCTQCGFPNLVCSCNVRHSLGGASTSSRLNLNSSSRESMILLGPSESNDRVEDLLARNESSNNPNNNSSSSSSSDGLQGGLGSSRTRGLGHSEVVPSEHASVSFRASTSIERFSLRDTSEPTPSGFPCSISRPRIVFPEGTRRFEAAGLLNLSRDKRLRESSETGVVARATPVVLEETTSPPSPDQVSTANKELDELHTRILSLIECPVCLEPIAPPVHQCRRGHLVCAKCKSQLHQCPTCRDKMCEMRNWAVERVAELLKYPCRNSGLGCLVTTLLSGKSSHESSCPFRHYNCLFRTCPWTGFQQEMLPHLRSTHPLRFLEGTRQQIDVELNSPTLFYTDWAISCFGRVFRFNVFQHIPNSMFYASAYLVGAGGEGGCTDSESNYTYSVTVNGLLGRRVSYTRQTHAESTRTSTLCHSEDCFSIRGDKMEHFVGDGGKLRLHVELEQLEPPVVSQSYEGN